MPTTSPCPKRSLASALAAVESVDLGDFFVFAVHRTTRLDAALEGAAVRYRVAAELAGRRFEEVTVDIGFGGPLVTPVDLLAGTDLLGFAGFDPITIPALPLVQHVAEKLHAYTRTYQGQQASSRVKESGRSGSDPVGGRLRGRCAQALPAALPLPPASWETTYPALAAEVGLDPDVAVGHRLAAAFLDPILSGTIADNAQWDPSAGTWRASSGS